MDKATLIQIDPVAVHAVDLDLLIASLNSELPKANINTTFRVCAFLSQVAEESGHFLRYRENLNYSAEALLKVWPTHFDKTNVDKYAHNPEKIANRAYANRMGNGDEASGDGWRYAGKGLIQLTGRDNYRHYAQATGVDALAHPELLTTPQVAVNSACWFWSVNDLNHWADVEDITSITKHVNGGVLGLSERKALYIQAKKYVHIN